jgi:hypothetical protein
MAFTERLHAEIEIDAPPEEVWEALTEFEAYPSWNPFLTSVEGPPTAGAKLNVRLEPPGGRGITMHPTVTESEPGRELAWLGRLGFPGVFDGAHRFEVEPLGDGRTRFVQSERFSGVLVPLLRRSLRSHTLAGFKAMNQALADRAGARR